jgi:hypothetical protein
VQGCDARGAQALLDTEVEPGRVDANVEIGRICAPALHQRLAQPKQPGQSTQYLRDPEYRQRLHRVEARKPGRAHLGSTNALEPGAGKARTKRPHQAGAQLVTGDLASHDRDTWTGT